MSSFWNNRISISIFGEAQGSAIGVTIDNLPAGEYINADELSAFMARRNPKNIGMCRKHENTVPHIMSGIRNDRTTGSPLCAFLQNSERIAPQHSEYDRVSRIGNADYTGAVRYRGFDDVREKCNFSERLTAPLCFAGAICGQILERRGIYTGAHIYCIHNIKDNPFDPVKVSRDAIISIRRKNFPVINDRKGWQAVRICTVCQPCHLRNKGISKPRQLLLTIVSEPPRQFPAQAVHRLSLHLLCPALAQMKMECCSNQRVLDSIGKPIAVQQIGLLSGVQLVQRHIQF